MTLRRVDTNAILKPETRIELRGASGRLYGYIDPLRMVLEFKRGGQEKEEIDLKKFLAKR